MKLNFTKMQGAGNDFVVIDAYSLPVSLTKAQIRQIANRTFGVGCDQLLMVEKTTTPDVDFRYRIFNADGAEVAQCGNGARCFARYVLEKDLTKKLEMTVETLSGVITLLMQADGLVSVNMGSPKFNPADVPFLVDTEQNQYQLPLENEVITISALSMGNPHAVTITNDVEAAAVDIIGPLIEAHLQFPEHVNAGFMQVVNAHEIKLRVYERGSGETLSCGSGACAAAVTGIQLGLIASPVLVNTRGGQLTINWAGGDNPVMMAGPAQIVFEGQITI